MHCVTLSHQISVIFIEEALRHWAQRDFHYGTGQELVLFSDHDPSVGKVCMYLSGHYKI